MNSPNYYSILTAEVRYSTEINADEKLLYSELSALSNKNGYCHANNTYFANLYNLSNRAISSRLSRLEKAGFIKIVIDKKAGNQRKIYLSEAYRSKHRDPIEDKRNTYRSQLPDPIEASFQHNNINRIIQDNNTSINNTLVNKVDDKSSQSADMISIFEYWVKVMSKDASRTIFNEKRKRAVKSRLGEGYTLEDICTAIDGCSRTPHNMGDNKDGKVWDDLELICRNGSNVERFIANSKQVKVNALPSGFQNLGDF